MDETEPNLKGCLNLTGPMADSAGKIIASSLRELGEAHPEAKKVIFTIVPNGKKISVQMCWR